MYIVTLSQLTDHASDANIDCQLSVEVKVDWLRNCIKCKATLPSLTSTTCLPTCVAASLGAKILDQ